MLYGIIADVHSNLEAFRAVVDELSSVDQIVCAGDIVGYGPDPNKCIALMREKNIQAVAGNHDKAAVGEMDLQWFNVNAKAAIEWTATQLTEDSREYLRALPLTLELPDFQVVHGSLRDPLKEYIMTIAVAGPNIELMNKPFLFVGHTHRPLHLSLEGKGIINPGSVGQPRDGDPRASFGIYDSEKNEFTLHRVEYNVQAVQEKMGRVGLPIPLIERLRFGR